MEKINSYSINKVKEEYLESDVYTIARHALNNHRMSEITRANERTEYTRNHFSINIETLEATNQKSSGRCWIFAGLNILRERVAKKFNIEKFELSQNYVAFYDKLEKSNYFLEKAIEFIDSDRDDRTYDLILTEGINDGGQWDMLVNIITKYGVVPQDAYPETFQSSNTAAVDNVLNTYLRKFAIEVKELKGNPDEIRAKKEKAIGDIYKVLCSCFGVPPTNFSFEFTDKDKEYHIYKDISPKEFYNDFVDMDMTQYVSIINAPTKDKPFDRLYTVKNLGNVAEGNAVKYLNLKMDRFKELVINQLKNGELVWFGSDCVQYADFKGGIWDDMYIDRDVLLQIDTQMTKEEQLDSRESAMNHAMVITGVNLDNDVPNKWKIENSWGDKDAFKGYHVATDSWFDRYVYQAVINKKYLSEEEVEILDSKPIELELWDPMGTLAN